MFKKGCGRDNDDDKNRKAKTSDIRTIKEYEAKNV